MISRKELNKVDDRYGWFEMNDVRQTLISLPKLVNNFILIEKEVKKHPQHGNPIGIFIYYLNEDKIAQKSFYYNNPYKLEQNYQDLIKMINFVSSYLPKYELYSGYKDIIFKKLSDGLLYKDEIFVNILNIYLHGMFISSWKDILEIELKEGNSYSLSIAFSSSEDCKRFRNEIRKSSSLIKKIWNDNKREGGLR